MLSGNKFAKFWRHASVPAGMEREIEAFLDDEVIHFNSSFRAAI